MDPEWRLGARQAHSGTHLLHAALLQVLGHAALQSGSYNRPGQLRLDFAWHTRLSNAERAEIERVTNLAVRDDLDVSVRYLPLQQARQIGALALFGETYGDTVRVVEIGGAWSRELCGGTHVTGSAQVGPVALVREGSVGSGYRRIEAVVGIEAFDHLARERDLVDRLATELRAPRDELPARLRALVDHFRAAEQTTEQLRARLRAADAARLAGGAEIRNGVCYVAATTAPDDDPRLLAEATLAATPADIAAVVAIVAARGAGAGSTIVVAANRTAIAAGHSAVDLARRITGGKAGGSPALAQGGVATPPGDALLALRALL